MFKKTDPNPQLDMFTSPTMQLGARALKKYTDPNAWHNQYFRMYTSKIDEERFRVLFPEGKKSGRPTASIRVLVSMSWLKEGFGCSDEELFEKCEFDLLTRKSLGLELISDVTPSLDTYYLFRRRICEYYEKTGIDLMQECFEAVTGSLVKQLKIAESDDAASNDLLSKLMAKLTDNPNAVLAFCHSTMIDSEGKALDYTWDQKWLYKSPGIYNGKAFCKKRMVLKNLLYNASMIVWRKDNFHNISDRYKNYRHCGDWLFWFDMAMQGDVAEVPEELSRFR